MGGRRQQLAVSHEKGKITVLQLGTLLRQTDSAKRKLTLPVSAHSSSLQLLTDVHNASLLKTGC